MQQDKPNATGLPIVEQLKMFYGANSDRELIMAMHYHINKLQGRKYNLPPNYAYLDSGYVVKARVA